MTQPMRPPVTGVPPHVAPPHVGPPPVAPPTGQLGWALGFLAYIPIPFVNIIATAITMIALYPGTKRKGVPLATANARIAANWGLTMLTVMVIFAAYLPIVETIPGANGHFFPGGVAILGYLALGVAHLVVTIMGTVISGRRRVFHNRLAIPYLRAPRADR